MSLSVLQYLILSGLLLLPVTVNQFSWQSPWISAIFGGVFFIFQSLILGRHFFGKRPMLRQALAGCLAFLLLTTICSTLVYLVWDLSIAAQMIAFLLEVAATAGLIWYVPHSGQTTFEMQRWSWPSHWRPNKHHLFIGAYLLMMAIAFWQLLGARTSMALSSPWPLLTPVFWVSAALATAILLILLWTETLGENASLLVSLHLFLFVSVALIIYRLGYGFDSFLHQTAEQIIATAGVVLPKTPYYLGQYSLVVSLHRLLGISLLTLDRLLLPVLTAVSLPFFCAEFVRGDPHVTFPALKQGQWLALLLFCLPFSSFIVTTPQGLGNLFFIWLILMSVPVLTKAPHAWPLPAFWVIAVAACLIHPLAGIPCLIFCTYLTFVLLKNQLGLSGFIIKLIETEAIVLCSVCLPFIFLLWGVFSQQGIRLKPFNEIHPWEALQKLLPLVPNLPQPFSPVFLAMAYQALHWLPFLVIITIFAVAIWLLLRGNGSLFTVYAASAFTFALNGILIGVFLQFPQIAAAESYAYADRLLLLAAWCFLPCLLLAALWAVRALQQKQPLYWGLLICLLTAGLLATLYGAYPRQNRFEKGHQFSTSATDFATTRAINDRSKSDFVVLANQSVSAAAVAQFGFKTYFPQSEGDSLFYYPLPTASPLYDIYLSMVNDAPRRDVAKRAYDLTGAHTVYFVVDSYWDNAALIDARAKMEADESFSIDNGAAQVFIYRFSSESTS